MHAVHPGRGAQSLPSSWRANTSPRSSRTTPSIAATAARAQLLADGELSAARRGVDRTEEEFESIAAKIRADLARGLSPAQRQFSAGSG